MKKKPTSAGFSVPCANGGRILKVVGTALPAIIPNISTTVAEQHGTLLLREAAVPVAAINGTGPRAYAARVGRAMKTGMVLNKMVQWT